MKITFVRVVFEKRVSDGNYGSENALVEYTAEIGPNDILDHVIKDLSDHARAAVTAQLAESDAYNIVRALQATTDR